MRFATSLLMICLTVHSLGAAELKLVYRHGAPVSAPAREEVDKQVWNGHIDFADWLDEDQIVFSNRVGKISCLSLTTRKINWTVDIQGELEAWSVARDVKRLAVSAPQEGRLGKWDIFIIDSQTGKEIRQLTEKTLGRLMKLDYVLPTALALAPDGKLLVCDYSDHYRRAGVVLDSKYERIVSTFPVDPMPRKMVVSPAGKRLATIASGADEGVLCVRDLAADEDVLLLGKRVLKSPGGITVSIDTPFHSNVCDGGGEQLVYTTDNSWSTGTVTVHHLKSKRVKSFNGRNGHIEIDVAFAQQRIALSGTSQNLAIVDFEGRLVAECKGATSDRNLCVKFSPSGKLIAVGSWDNTLSVFELVE